MIVDTVILVLCGLVLVLSLTTPYMNALFRRPQTDDDDSLLSSPPPVTIIITSHGNASQLDEHLPVFLTQDYEPGYEVIIVGERNDHQTEDILKRYSGHPHLYSTFIPETSRYMSRKKLAITLGMKAARNEWVIITDPTCKPNSTQWLSTLSAYFTENTDMVLGYTNYESTAPDFYRFEHLYTALYIFREAQHRDAYRTNCYHLAMRKSVFLNGNGFQGNLKYTISEYDYLVNKFADLRTRICLRQDSWLTEDTPTVKQWENKHIFLRETINHLRHTRRHYLLFHLDQWALYVNYAAIVCTATLGIWRQQWIACAMAVIALGLTFSIRMMIAKRTFEEYGQPIAAWKVIPYEISMIWRNMRNRIRYENADKYDFISHKV